MTSIQKPHCKKLVLDAGPLLSLSPIRGLADTYYTVPEVLAELKDKRAREHFEQLGLISGVKVVVQSADLVSLAHVIQWAKKTGDYAVLSHADLCVLALTYALQEEANRLKAQIVQVEELKSESAVAIEEVAEQLQGVSLDGSEPLPDDDTPSEDHSKNFTPLDDIQSASLPDDDAADEDEHAQDSPPTIFEDPSDSDDGEGEWITPSNVGLHKSRAMDLLPHEGGSKGGRKHKPDPIIDAGCMTADFAMQNVLLQMGLTLVGTEGKRIERVKTWVLRCHACFKICKDVSKQFCPTCGGNTLLRASVTLSAPNASTGAPVMQVHLKPNFQYRIRGTKYSIPAPKAGSAKTGSGEGLILREDQVEYMRAQKHAKGKREREEAKMLKGILKRGLEGPVGVGSWMDPDWVPEMISVGSGGRGRTTQGSTGSGGLPVIGYGRKNPNERRRNQR